MHPARALPAVVLLMGLVACGTTVREAAGGSGSMDPGGGGFDASVPSGAPGVPSSGAPAEGSPAGVAAPGQPRSGAATGGTGGAGPSTPGLPGAKGPGFTATTIKIGFATQNDVPPLAGPFGFSADFGDSEAQIKALFADVNRRGGVLGRKLVPVFHDVGTVDSNTDSAIVEQRTCAAWTEDERVFAALSNVGVTNGAGLFACLAKAKVPLFFSDTSGHTRNLFSRYRSTLYGPGMLTLERLLPTLMSRLQAQGYFGPWDTVTGSAGGAKPVKVGLFYADKDESGQVFQKLTRRELASRGITIGSEYAYDGDITTAGRDSASAALQFSSAGVTHVLSDGGAVAFFMKGADQQAYHPRYGLSTMNSLSFATSTPSTQLKGALGVSWVPYADVKADQAPAKNRAAKQCLDLMRAAGQETTDYATQWVMQINCDSVRLLVDGLRLAQSISVAGLEAGIDGLSGNAVTGLAFAARFTPGRHDGAAAVRDLAYDGGCSCFRYPNVVDHAV